jgi:hypothetical protein
MPQNSLGRAFVADLFRDHPPALDLLNEVVGFFGTSLQVLATETAGDDASDYVINVDGGNLVYHDASRAWPRARTTSGEYPRSRWWRTAQTSTYTGAPVLNPTDERGWETGRCRMAQVTAPILDST